MDSHFPLIYPNHHQDNFGLELFADWLNRFSLSRRDFALAKLYCSTYARSHHESHHDFSVTATEITPLAKKGGVRYYGCVIRCGDTSRATERRERLIAYPVLSQIAKSGEKAGLGGISWEIRKVAGIPENIS